MTVADHPDFRPEHLPSGTVATERADETLVKAVERECKYSKELRDPAAALKVLRKALDLAHDAAGVCRADASPGVHLAVAAVRLRLGEVRASLGLRAEALTEARLAVA